MARDEVKQFCRAEYPQAEAMSCGALTTAQGATASAGAAWASLRCRGTSFPPPVSEETLTSVQARHRHAIPRVPERSPPRD